MELAEFRSKASNRNSKVGTEDHMKQLKKQTQEMETFCSDIKATVQVGVIFFFHALKRKSCFFSPLPYFISQERNWHIAAEKLRLNRTPQDLHRAFLTAICTVTPLFMLYCSQLHICLVLYIFYFHHRIRIRKYRTRKLYVWICSQWLRNVECDRT